MRRISRLVGLIVAVSLLGHPGLSQAEESLDEIAIELINPAGSLASIGNEFSYSTFQGSLPEAGDQHKGRYLITPSIPFKLGNGKNIVLRATIPLSFGTPTYLTEERDYADWLIRKKADVIATDKEFINGHGHLKDISYNIAYGGVNENGFISMFGVAGVLPTSQDGSIERDQFLLGPEVALGKMTRWGIFGGWLKHLVDVAEIDGRDIDYDTNETSLKVFFAYGLNNGWQIISNPLIEYDWEGAPDNKLLLPIGGGFSKMTRIGKIPMKMDFELYHYIESPEAFGPEWMLTFNFTPVLWSR